MKARSALAAVVAVLAAVLVAPHALAKGPGLEHATLDGPGIGEPIRIKPHYPFLLDEAVFMHLSEPADRHGIAREEPGAGDLGPRFELRYAVGFGEWVHVDFYPYADKGPVAFLGPGQVVSVPVGHSDEVVNSPVHPGWYDYKPGLVKLLQSHGMPEEDEIRHTRTALLIPLTVVVITVGVAAMRRRGSGPWTV